MLAAFTIVSFFVFAELDEGKMTVGKIYAGLLIAENWKAYKASQSANSNYRMVRTGPTPAETWGEGARGCKCH